MIVTMASYSMNNDLLEAIYNKIELENTFE